MLAVVLIGVGQATVVASGNLGLVGVDEDLGVAVGAAATVTSDHSIVSPSDGLLVDQLDRRLGLRLDREVCLLESGTGHGLGTRALASGPDANAVGSLADLDRLGLVDGGGGRLGGLRGNGGLELPSRGGEGALGESRAARQDTNCPQLRCGHRDCVHAVT